MVTIIEKKLNLIELLLCARGPNQDSINFGRGNTRHEEAAENRQT